MGSEFVARKPSVWAKKSDTKPSLFTSRPFSEPIHEQNTVNKKELPKEIPPPNYIFNKNGFNSSQPTVQRQEDNSDKEQEPDLMSKSDSPVVDEEETISPSLEDENKQENVNLKPAVEEGDEETISPQLEQQNQEEETISPQLEDENKQEELNKKSIQTKLTVGEPGDKYEQEADTVAAKVVEQINSPKSQQPVQGKVEPVVQPTLMRQGGAGSGTVNRDVEQNIQQARGGGQGLADNVRQPMEQAFGADFSGVKVHTGGQADVLNRSLNSRAFATGQDIFFKQGEYQPGSRGGQELLAHELTHVVQQKSNLNGIQCAIQSPRFSDNTHLKDAYNDKSYTRKGNSGLQVRLIQQALLDAGYSLPKYGVDGKFGSETEAAVKAFQKAQKAPKLNDDGIVGPKTMKALDTFFLNHGAMAAIPQGQVPSTLPTEGVEWNSMSIPPELLEGTRALTNEEKAEVERRRTTEVKAPKGGKSPVFKMNIPTSTDSYETRVEKTTNDTIDRQYNSLAKGKADARKYPDKNLYKWDIVEKIASLSKAETDQVFGNYAKGKPFKPNVNLKDAWEEKEKQFTAGGKGYEDRAVEWRVNKIFGGSQIRKIDREHGAIQSRATEIGILTNIRNKIISKRRAELIEIHKGWPGFAANGGVYLQRFVSADNGKNRDNMWDLFQTVVHEYIHTLEHSKHVKYRNTLGELKGDKTYREGMTEYFTKIVLESVTYNDSLRKEVEGPYHDPKIKHPIPPYYGYDEAKNAEAVVGVVGIKNAMAAFFAGRVDLIGG